MLGNNTYTIEYLSSVIEEDIPNLPKTARTIIKKAIEERLMMDPIGFGKPLRYSLKGHRRLCVSDYRIVYKIEKKTNIALIVAIKIKTTTRTEARKVAKESQQTTVDNQKSSAF